MIDIIEQCPECDNCGYYIIIGYKDKPEQVQCEFCYTNPNSQFNFNVTAQARIKELESSLNSYKLKQLERERSKG